eukprot:10757995-Alexandrium_andersonii.AAC.1
MSASLVGSEMCIRDRPIAAGLPDRLLDFALDRLLGWPTDSPVACSEVPVSYTHLTLPTICSV